MKLKNITKKYGDTTVFENFSLQLEDRKITAVLGASGSGKTTLLNVISGITDYSGSVECDGRVSYMFQTPRLLENLNVYKNLEYVLSGLPKEQRAVVIEQILKKVELWNERNKFPKELSGGMAQRVSLARAFVFHSDVLIMDEPFKGLDISLKKRIISEFKNLYLSDPRTTVFVTHDIDDALLIADRAIVLGKNEIIADIPLIQPLETRTLKDFAIEKETLFAIL